jgi:adenosine deaminase/aminodeoxyfutalosine deaminase
MPTTSVEHIIAALPKAELHLHLEGAIEPATTVELAARYGVTLTQNEAAAHYNYSDFAGFLEAFKWVTSLLRAPADYALITERLAGQLLAQNVVYAEVTLSIGVMLLREQNVEANFAAVARAADQVQRRGLQLRWIFDAVRQFGPDAAMEVARWAARFRAHGVAAFGLGGDELALPAADFRSVYDFARSEGLHGVVHAGEIGGPQGVRDAVELLAAERIGHGIAASADPALAELLTARRIALEVCPTSNLRTGALARLLAKPGARVEDHPLRTLFQCAVPITLSTDDPAMFRTTLNDEYALLPRLGFTPTEIADVARASFEYAFLPKEEKRALLDAFRAAEKSLGLL